MKLIFCPECHDVLKLLSDQTRYCDCSKSWGSYSGPVQASIGGSAIPLGFANTSLALALKYRPDKGRGKPFDAFVIPKVCPTIREEESA